MQAEWCNGAARTGKKYAGFERSKYRYVTYYKPTNKWAANVVRNGKGYWLGYHSSELDAHNIVEKKLAEMRRLTLTEKTNDS